HPLSASVPLETAIANERAQMAPIRDIADRVIDTTRFNAHELRGFLKEEFAAAEEAPALLISVISFGYKYGVPVESDLVFDLRFVQNPYFEEKLKSLNGLERPVVAFLESVPAYTEFLARLDEFLAFLLPAFVKEGKSYLTLAIGCTGGKHRSVAAAEAI